MTQPLAGIHILVTRPAHQARSLAERISEAGGVPVLFPVLEIQDTLNPAPFLKLIERLDEFDLAIFVSPNAVNKAMSAICAHRTVPSTLKIAAVGPGTAQALEVFEIREVIVPSARFDSEALLDMPGLQQMRDKRVIIFRGDGGRDMLGDSLKNRGATVEYAECYRRVKPNLDSAPLLQLWESGRMDAVTITSSEGLRNLREMVGVAGVAWLEKTPLFTSHERIAEMARKYGFEHVVLTDAGDAGLMESLVVHFQDRASEAMHQPDDER